MVEKLFMVEFHTTLHQGIFAVSNRDFKREGKRERNTIFMKYLE